MGDHPSASIRFERLVIENYKAFVRGEVEFHPEATVFIGTNASGKTSLIEVLDLLNGVSGNAQPDWLRRLFLNRSREGFVGCFPWMDASRPMAFEVHAILEERPLRYRLALEADAEGRPRIVEERLWDDTQEWATLENGRWRIPPAGLHLEVGTADYPLVLSSRGEWTFQEHRLDVPLRFVQWVQGWFVLRPQALGAGRSWDQLDIARHLRLDRQGENFAPVLFYWKNEPNLRPRWDWVYERTRILLDHLGLSDVRWDVIHKPAQERALAQVRLWMGDQFEHSYDLAFGPDGLRQWLIVLTALSTPSAPLVAIEEPEVHLDLRMQDLLAETLQSAVYHFYRPFGRQLLVTTHSPVLAGEWPPEHIRLLHRGRIEPLPDFLARALQEDRIRLLEAWLLDMLTEAPPHGIP
jgi:hypothetical protein